MVNSSRNRVYAAAFTAIVIAAVIATVVGTSFRPPDRWFMPGPLGRERALTRAVVRTTNNGAARITSNAAGLPLDRSTARPIDRPRGFLTRHIGLRTPEEQEWGRRNGVTDSLPFSHNLHTVFPPKLYSERPEFFPLVDGKRLQPPATGSVFWNPDLGREDVARYAAEKAKQHFRQNPDAVSFALGENDGLVFGESSETLALIMPPRWFRNRPDYSRLVFTFMNRTAAELAREFPDKYLGCLAYYWAENVPGFAVDPHVIPFLTADGAQGYDPAFVAEERELQKKWAAAVLSVRGKTEKLKTEMLKGRPSTSSGSLFERVDAFRQAQGRSSSEKANGSVAQPSIFGFQPAESRFQRRLGLYEYLDGYGFLVPRIPIHAFVEHMRNAYRAGFTDYYGESSRNWGLDGPMPWVIAQMLQEPEQDLEPLLNEYYTSYFQEAAEPMRRFFERSERQWMQQAGPSYWLKHYRNESQAALFPSAVCAELRQLLEEAERLANGRSVEQKFGRTEGQAEGSTVERRDGPLRQAQGRSSSEDDTVRRRVAFVSEAFGVTERFVAFCEARNELTNRILRRELHGSDGERLLADYLQKRREFIRDTKHTMERWPLAFYPIDFDDWLRNEPSFAAAMAQEGGGQRAEGGRTVERSSSQTEGRSVGRAVERSNGALREAQGRFSSERGEQGSNHFTEGNEGKEEAEGGGRRTEDRRRTGPDTWSLAHETFPAVAAARTAAESIHAGHIREVLPNGSLAGPVRPGRRIAGLMYGIDLPQPWQSKVEPTEAHIAELRAEGGGQKAEGGGQKAEGGGQKAEDGGRRAEDRKDSRAVEQSNGRALRIVGAENTHVYQWVTVTSGRVYIASVRGRGLVSPSDTITLALAWLDADQKHIGKPTVMRLPDGAWQDWVELQQGARAPANAKWAGISIRVQHQTDEDWVELRDFSIKEVLPATVGG